MTLRRRRDPDDPGGGDGHGFGGFLRSLLAGIPWSERATGEQTVRLAAPGGGIVRIHNTNGRAIVIGEERDDIEVQIAKTARAESADAANELLDEIRLMHDTGGDGSLELDVEVPRKWNRRGHANLELRVPRGTSVDVAVSNGKIAVSSLSGRVRARSSNGSVTIDDVRGDIEVATTNAKVCCAGTCGKLVARSSNGKIELDEHRGSVDASTSNGLIRVSMGEIGKAGVLLATSNGRILLELPEEVDAEVDIRVDNGVIRNDRVLRKATRATNGQVRGQLGAGGPLIKLRTSNGSISLR
jgi:DUF4097 and DUF4098 domain-containing protein YvlB